jgi:Fe-S-cluster-containing hydrogenase component 2
MELNSSASKGFPTGKTLIVEPQKCTGCKVCELVCSSFHYGEYNPSKSHIRISKNNEMCIFIPILNVKCDLCDGLEMCEKWCPEGVLEFVPWFEAAKRRRDVKMGKFPATYFGEWGQKR